MRVLVKYFHIWYLLTLNSFMSILTSRFGAGIFLLGKALRFIFFIIFLLTLFTKNQLLAQYTMMQILLFYLTFAVIDDTTQLFFREVYRFRPMVVSGDFDLVLVKPLNPLFRALAGGADPLDLIMLVPYSITLVYVISQLHIVSIVSVVSYILLLINALIIATGFHILVLALAILTTEIDHAIMIYRDFTSMGRIPVDIYREPLRGLITFVVPVGIMMTYPAKALMGLLSPFFILGSCVFGIAFVWMCLRVWKYALGHYASASS